jgi:glutathione S-transferase
MLNVYLDPCTVNSRKVLAGLDLLGTEYQFHHIDYFTGEHKSDSYKKINPHATVPSATDGDLNITESNAILQYAADLKDSPYYPKDLKQRANVNRWLLWEASAWFASNYTYLVEYVVKPLLKAEPDESVIAGEAPRWNRFAAILDEQLAKTKWLAGDELTIADIAVAAPMHLHAAQRLPLEKYRHLNRWLGEGVEKLPCWQKTQGAVDKALLPQKAAANGVTNRATNGTGDSVRATFNYTKDVLPQLTELYFYETEKAKNIHEPGDSPHEMQITDGWYRAKSFSTDKEGFALRDFHTKYEDWEDENKMRAEFYPDVVEFLQKETGASRILVFDHTIRTEKNAAMKLTQETNTSQRAPVMLVHCDYTAESGPVRVQQLLPDEAEKLLSKRVAFYNVWKPVHRVVEEKPLAMCDVTSTPPDDYFKLFLRYRDRTGENYVMRHSPNHKWWYFPKMTPEQVIILKTFDSVTDGRARFVGHSAFTDPTSPKDAPLRESVEIRTIAFYD